MTVAEILAHHSLNWDECNCGIRFVPEDMSESVTELWSEHAEAEIRKAFTIANKGPHHYMNAGGFCHAGDAFESGTGFIALYIEAPVAKQEVPW